MNSRRPISRLVSPSARSLRTSSSRRVRPARPPSTSASSSARRYELQACAPGESRDVRQQRFRAEGRAPSGRRRRAAAPPRGARRSRPAVPRPGAAERRQPDAALRGRGTAPPLQPSAPPRARPVARATSAWASAWWASASGGAAGAGRDDAVRVGREPPSARTTPRSASARRRCARASSASSASARIPGRQQRRRVQRVHLGEIGQAGVDVPARAGRIALDEREHGTRRADRGHELARQPVGDRERAIEMAPCRVHLTARAHAAGRRSRDASPRSSDRGSSAPPAPAAPPPRPSARAAAGRRRRSRT